jgi:hypothetical protein
VLSPSDLTNYVLTFEVFTATHCHEVLSTAWLCNVEETFDFLPVSLAAEAEATSFEIHSVLIPLEGNRLFNPLKPELNPICYLLALLGAHHFLHVSRIRVKL